MDVVPVTVADGVGVVVRVSVKVAVEVGVPLGVDDSVNVLDGVEVDVRVWV